MATTMAVRSGLKVSVSIRQVNMLMPNVPGNISPVYTWLVFAGIHIIESVVD